MYDVGCDEVGPCGQRKEERDLVNVRTSLSRSRQKRLSAMMCPATMPFDEADHPGRRAVGVDGADGGEEQALLLECLVVPHPPVGLDRGRGLGTPAGPPPETLRSGRR